jgi:hypothetical protein
MSKDTFFRSFWLGATPNLSTSKGLPLAFQQQQQFDWCSSSHSAIMPNPLLAFITPRRSPTNETSATATVEQQRSSVQGTMRRIGMLLNPPHHNNLTTASPSHHTPIPISRIINQPSASSTANSPVRTRKNKNSSATFIQSTFGPSPRHGAKSKQRRVDGFLDGHLQTNNGYVSEWQFYSSNGFGFLGKPTTEFMGWRRLTPNDLLNLDVGSFLLMSVPRDLRHEDRDTIKLRAAFKKRLTEAVIRSKSNEFPNNGKSV